MLISETTIPYFDWWYVADWTALVTVLVGLLLASVAGGRVGRILGTRFRMQFAGLVVALAVSGIAAWGAYHAWCWIDARLTFGTTALWVRLNTTSTSGAVTAKTWAELRAFLQERSAELVWVPLEARSITFTLWVSPAVAGCAAAFTARRRGGSHAPN